MAALKATGVSKPGSFAGLMNSRDPQRGYLTRTVALGVEEFYKVFHAIKSQVRCDPMRHEKLRSLRLTLRFDGRRMTARVHLQPPFVVTQLRKTLRPTS